MIAVGIDPVLYLSLCNFTRVLLSLVGGIVTAPMVSMLLIPVLYQWWKGRGMRRFFAAKHAKGAKMLPVQAALAANESR